jgi:hypothetical protein
MSASADRGAPVDTTVRIIVVHGIGNQRIGATAARWSDAFVRFGRAATYVPEVSTAMLTDDPSRVTVRLTGPHRVPFRNRTVELAVEEAHWAESFAEPTLGRVLRFLLTVAPVLAITQTILIWRTHGGAEGRDRALHRPLWHGFTVVGPLGLGIVLLGVAAPLVAVLLLLLLVGAALPVPAVRRVVGRGLGWLSASIGDAYLFVADPVNRAAMETRLAQRLAEASSMPTDRTVILAHSQGAALAYRALTALQDMQRPASLITVGSGVGRLRQVGLLQTIPWFLTPVFLGVVACASVGIAVWELLPTTLLLLAAVLLTAIAWAVCRRWLDDSREEDGSLPPPLAGVTWLDIAARIDPVPNGPATADAGAQGRYQFALVAGELSVVRDHVRYDLDWDQTLPLVLARVLDPAATEPLPYVGVRPDRADGRLAHPWAARDRWGVVLRSVPLLAAAAALAEADLFRLGQWLRTAPPGWLDGTVSAVFVPIRTLCDLLDHPWFRSPRPQTVLGIVAVLALGVGGSILTRRVLTFFQRRETSRWLSAGGLLHGGGSRRSGRWTGWRWPAAFACVALAAAVVPLLLAGWEQRVHWTQQQAVEAYVRAVAEDDVHAQCQMTTQPEGGDGPLRNCGDQEELLRTCDDARSAVDALPEDAVSLAGTRVEIDWAPEVPPVCDDRDHRLLVPTRVERVDGDWLVGEVSPLQPLSEEQEAEE